MKTKALTLLLALCSFSLFGQQRNSNNDASVAIEPLPDVCPTPKNFTGEYYWEDNEFGARLAWDKAEYEYTLDRFEIYRSTDGENFKMVKRIVNTPSISHYECIDIVENANRYIYRIIAFYQNECDSDPLDIEISVTSVNDHSVSHVEVYPIPTSGTITIESNELTHIQIVNSLGQTIHQAFLESEKVTLDLSPFGKGLYLIQLKNENGLMTKKVIVE